MKTGLFNKKLLIIATTLAILLLLNACSLQKDLSSKEDIIQIACGDEFTLFLYNTGKVYAIGKNTVGQLGVGDFEDRYVLTEVLLPEAVSYISASDDNACALTKDGILYAWGDNRYKQAVDVTDFAISKPTRIPLDEKVKLCALGWTSTYAWTDSGRLYGWGLKGTLLTYDYVTHTPNYEARPITQKIIFPWLGETEKTKYQNPKDILYLSAGLGSILGIDSDGVLFGRSTDNFALSYPPGEIIKIGSGTSFHALLTKEGSLYLWGSNIHGELGNGNLSVQNKPQFLSFENDPLQDIAVGPNHILAVSKSGKLLAWGNNSQYQLGLANNNDILIPTVVALPEKVVSVFTGVTHSYAFGESGKLYAFGTNQYGQLFTGDQKTQISPIGVELGATLSNIEKVVYPELKKENIKTITGTKFLTETGKVFTIGTSYYAKLGTGNIDTAYYPPVHIPFPEKIVELDEGMFAVIALTESGQIYNWGYNQGHALGREHTKWHYSPTLLPIPEKIIKIHSGIYSTAALSESGKWYLWGDNTYGGLMTGDMVPISEPIIINTPEAFIDIAPGLAHSLTLTAKGEVYLWGNYRVSIGDGDTLVREVTMADLNYHKMPFLEVISKIAVGDQTCYALSETGNLYVWGYDELGFLGLGTEPDNGFMSGVDRIPDGNPYLQVEPVIVLKEVEDFSLSPEGRSVLAVTRLGDVYAWGEMGYDDDMQYIYANYPERIAFPGKITGVFSGDGLFYAVGQNKIYTWGFNYLEKNGKPLQKPILLP